MTEIRFYHLTRQTLDQVLPDLLEKILARGMRGIVMTGSPERVEALNQTLWSYREDSFLPHGAAKNGNAAEQPVWLTDRDENPNGAQILLLTDGARSSRIAHYEMVCLLFDGNDPDAVASTRQLWKGWQADGHALTYWQQGERGWAQKSAV